MFALDTSIIIPAFNESARLEEGFTRLEVAAAEGRVDLERTEILFVDDGSSDDTAAVATKIAARLPHGTVVSHTENRGKGAAIRSGVAAAAGPRVIFTDADLAIDPRQIPSLLAALETSPVAVGTRAVGGHVDYGTWLRTRAGRIFNVLVRSLSDITLRDTQCGFKGARTAEAKILFHYTTIDGFAFDVEFLSRARTLGWSVAEVPVSWRDVPGSHVDVARHSVTMLTDLARARFRSRSLPALLGLDVAEGSSLEAIAAACSATSLQAAPVLVDAVGRKTVLAALHVPVDASPALRRLSTALGDGRVRSVTAAEIRDAAKIEIALAPI